MVSTRSFKGKAADKPLSVVPIKTEVATPVAAPPKKRQKRAHDTKEGIAVTVLPAEGLAGPVSEAVEVKAKVKGTKKPKRLLQTLHTDKDLPAIRQKATQVSNKILCLTFRATISYDGEKLMKTCSKYGLI